MAAGGGDLERAFCRQLPAHVGKVAVRAFIGTIERRSGERAPTEEGLTSEASIRITSKRYCGKCPSEV